MSATDAVPQPDGGSGAPAQGIEPLACVSCRSRKLKCDRTRPACARCVKVKNGCVYPESRRKPTFKRKNVKELEARLVQVEEYLKDVSRANGAAEASAEAGILSDEPEISLGDFSFQPDDISQSANASGMLDPQMSFDMPFFPGQDNNLFGNGFSGQLVGLGMSESLPPFDVIEELHKIFFLNHYHYLPIVHFGRYSQAFYGGSLRKPPMCLQYAIWAMAANGHTKYNQYADIFYKRARQYTEADEMKDDGEHFITVAHAQAWAILASYEAKSMLFTRASMSSARCTRLVQMMGLDRLDREDDDIPPTLDSATSWTELEERRRVFWGAFAIDAHASMSTGWAHFINSDEVMTRLPASEAAFVSGLEEKTAFLDEVFDRGANFDDFAGAIVVCQNFKIIWRHIHRVKPSDEPEDLTHGTFWKRHRELDNKLSSLFVYLPEKLRLPQNLRDASAVHTNLNLHASVICLHHAALEVVDKHGLPDSVKQTSQYRLRAAAEEIANIVNMTTHNTNMFKSPLCALSLYCATTVYVYLAKVERISGLRPPDIPNLKIIMSAMEAIGRAHNMTSGFLQQTCLDIERNGLSSSLRLSCLSQYRDVFGDPASQIPLVARTSISKHTEPCSPLPGRLPLRTPKGIMHPRHLRMTKPVPPLTSLSASEVAMGDMKKVGCFRPILGAVTRNMAPKPQPFDFASQKRKRMSPSPGPVNQGSSRTAFNDSTDSGSNLLKQCLTTSADQLGAGSPKSGDVETRGQLVDGAFVLPDRTDSSASSPGHRGTGTATLSGSSYTSPSLGLGDTREENRIDLRQFQGRVSTPLWQTTEEGIFVYMTETIAHLSGDVNDPWALLDGNLGWDDNAPAG